MVPSVRQTVCPATSKEVKLADTPTKFAKYAFVPVVLVPVAFTQAKFVPEAVAKPNHCVEVTRVNDPSTATKFVSEAFVANKLVEVALVDVTLVNVAAAGVRFPITVPFTAPPVIATFEEFKFNAFNVVPEAVAKPSQALDVAFVTTRLSAVAVPVTFKFVVTKFPVDVPPPNSMVEVATLP